MKCNSYRLGILLDILAVKLSLVAMTNMYVLGILSVSVVCTYYVCTIIVV